MSTSLQFPVPLPTGSLQTTTDTVDVAGSAVPSSGKILTAVDSTHATWQSPAAGYTDEQAQDAVGSILTETATIDFTYDDAGNKIKADVKANSLDNTFLHLSAPSKLLGRMTAGAGAGEELVLDPDVTLAANSDSIIATQKAVKAFVAAQVASLLKFKSNTDCSGNPNYPVGVIGDAYVVSVAGKIGGASGTSVDVGDVYACSANNAGGTEAGVGASWFHMEHNIIGPLLAANNLSDLGSVAAAKVNLSLNNVENTALSTWAGTVNVLLQNLGGVLTAVLGGTGQSVYAIGDLLSATTTTTFAKIAAVAAGKVLRSKGANTLPAWEQLVLTSDVTGTLPVANGGTGVVTAAAEELRLIASRANEVFIGKIFVDFGTASLSKLAFVGIPSLTATGGALAGVGTALGYGVKITTNAVLNGDGGFASPSSAHYRVGFNLKTDFYFVSDTDISSLRYIMGWSEGIALGTTPSTNSLQLQVDSTVNGNTRFYFLNQGGGSGTSTDSTITLAANTPYRFRIVVAGGGTVTMSLWSLSAGLWSQLATVTVTTNLPADNFDMSHNFAVRSLQALTAKVVTFHEVITSKTLLG